MGPFTTIRPDHYENTAAARLAAQANYAPGETVGERDSGDIHVRTTSGWAMVASGGATVSRLTATEIPFPEQYFLPFTGSATTQTSATLVTLGDVSMYNRTEFEVTSISGTTPAVKAYPSYDGVNYSATPLALIDLSSGTLGTGIAGSTGATAVGNYAIAGVAGKHKIKSLQLKYTASVAGSVAIRGGCGVA
jgi:hypothetical protein